MIEITLVGIYAATSPSLGFDNRQRRQASRAKVVVDFCGSLQEGGCDSRKHRQGYASRPGGAAKKKGHLPISGGLLGEIIINDKSVLAIIPEIFADRTASVRGNILHRRRVGGCGGDNCRVLHGAFFFQGFNNLGDCGAFLADSDVDAINILALLV